MMMIDLFKRSSRPSAKTALRKQAEKLLAQTMRAARDPGLFGPGGISDDFSGRFDAVAMVAALVCKRLGAIGEEAVALNQAFVNALFKSFDDALREDGVGDLTVPKKMQRLAEAFYGRAAAYRTALELIESGAAEGNSALADALHRNLLRGEESTSGAAQLFGRHAWALWTVLEKASLSDLSNGALNWPRFDRADGTA